MKKGLYSSLGMLAILFICASPALADVYNYNFLFSGQTTWNDNGAEDIQSHTASVAMKFDTDNSIGSLPYAGGDSYVFDVADVAMTINGNDWASYVPFDFGTQLFVELVDGILYSVGADYTYTRGNDFIGESNFLNFSFVNDVVPGEYSLFGYWEQGESYLGQRSTEFVQVAGTLATSATPIPAAIWLLGSGLVGLVGIRRRTNLA